MYWKLRSQVASASREMSHGTTSSYVSLIMVSMWIFCWYKYNTYLMPQTTQTFYIEIRSLHKRRL